MGRVGIAWRPVPRVHQPCVPVFVLYKFNDSKFDFNYDVLTYTVKHFIFEIRNGTEKCPGRPAGFAGRRDQDRHPDTYTHLTDQSPRQLPADKHVE